MSPRLTPEDVADRIAGEDGPGHVDPDAVLAGVALALWGDVGSGSSTPSLDGDSFRLRVVEALLIRAGLERPAGALAALENSRENRPEKT